ncbi:MAG: adenylosuccinate synthetase [Ferruginibacter sp.]
MCSVSNEQSRNRICFIKVFLGWKQDITGIKTYEALPEKMKEYINYMNTFLKVPVKYISNGP